MRSSVRTAEQRVDVFERGIYHQRVCVTVLSLFGFDRKVFRRKKLSRLIFIERRVDYRVPAETLRHGYLGRQLGREGILDFQMHAPRTIRSDGQLIIHLKTARKENKKQ